MTNLPDWVMDPHHEVVITWIFGLWAAATLLQALLHSWKRRSWFPLLLFAGCGLSVFYEPTNDVLGHCFYTENGMNYVWLEMLGRKIPYYIGFCFFFYYYSFISYCMNLLQEGASLRKWMSVFGVSVASLMAFELIPIHYHIWGYYGANQPLQFFGFPIWWAFANAECLMSVAVALFLLRRHALGGMAAELVGLLTPILTFMAHGGAAMPVTVAINTSDNIAVTTAASLLTIAVATGLAWGGYRLKQGLDSRSAPALAAGARNGLLRTGIAG